MITILICSMALAVPCTADNATEVIKLRQYGSVCNPYPELAQISVVKDLRPDERIVVKCP